MPRQLPPFSAVKAFEAAARNGSFARAAQELDVTATAISQHVKGLEGWLGETLFERQANGVTLTQKGDEILSGVSHILDELASLLPPEKGNIEPVKVTLSAPSEWADGWLIPLLSDLEKDNPGMRVELRPPAKLNRFEQDPSLDFLLGPFSSPKNGLLSDWLFDDALVPVCSAQYRDILGLQDEHNWRSVTLLHDSLWEGDWQRWAHAKETTMLDWQSGLRFPNHHLAVEAAKQGLGILIAHAPAVQSALKEGSLVALQDAILPTGQSYYLIRRRGHNTPAAIQLRAWFLGKMRQG